VEWPLRVALDLRRPMRGAFAAALAVVVAVTTAPAQSDSAPPDRGRVEAQSDGAVQSRYVTIPFTVGPADCTDRTRTYTVTMRIYNVLAQHVGIPTLAAVSPSGDRVPAGGRPLVGLSLPCGQFIAVWNGRHPATGLRVAPGVYVYDLVIDGQRITRKVTLGRLTSAASAEARHRGP
jgi:hypothetical protein